MDSRFFKRSASSQGSFLPPRSKCFSKKINAGGMWEDFNMQHLCEPLQFLKSIKNINSLTGTRLTEAAELRSKLICPFTHGSLWKPAEHPHTGTTEGLWAGKDVPALTSPPVPPPYSPSTPPPHLQWYSPPCCTESQSEPSGLQEGGKQ